MPTSVNRIKNKKKENSWISPTSPPTALLSPSTHHTAARWICPLAGGGCPLTRSACCLLDLTTTGTDLASSGRSRHHGRRSARLSVAVVVEVVRQWIHSVVVCDGGSECGPPRPRATGELGRVEPLLESTRTARLHRRGAARLGLCPRSLEGRRLPGERSLFGFGN
jgi:hypothetical protein